MNIINDAGRVITRAADATAAAAGALGGAAVDGVIGGVEGTAAGVRKGLGSGRRSTPAAVLTFAAIGAAGLVEWPVVVAVGGTALLVRLLGQHSNVAAPQLQAVADSAPAPRATAKNATGKNSPRKPARTRSPRSTSSTPH